METKISSFQDLKVWQKAHEFVLSIYKITKDFPDSERYGLISQVRRAAMSIPANLAEGGKRTKKEFIHFINIAEGSLEEVKYYLVLSKDLEYINIVEFEGLTNNSDEIGRILYGLKKGLLNS